MSKKKVLWHSNSPLAGTGYGNQTYIFSKILKEAGYDVTISATYGLSGSSIEFDGITILPRGLDKAGNDVLGAHYEVLKPDILFTLIDSWILNPNIISKLPLAVWTPIDHDPVPPKVTEVMDAISFPVAMSKFGESALRDEGVDPYYIPHGVVTNIFEPKDKTEARKRFKVEDDVFVAIMNAANKGYPCRKSFESVLKAWKAFTDKHPRSILYMHTLPVENFGGLDFDAALKFYHLDRGQVRFPNMYKYVMGEYKWDFLVDMYNMADVLLAPSMGEGFGIPVVEAHACGCPTIVTDFSAQAELGATYKIPINRFDDLRIMPQRSEQAFVLPSQILAGLEWVYNHEHPEQLREQAREAAMPYDALVVFERYMQPVFEAIADITAIQNA